MTDMLGCLLAATGFVSGMVVAFIIADMRKTGK